MQTQKLNCSCSDNAVKSGLCLYILGLLLWHVLYFFSHFEAAINCYLVTFLLCEDFKVGVPQTQNVEVLVCAVPVFFNSWLGALLFCSLSLTRLHIIFYHNWKNCCLTVRCDFFAFYFSYSS
jgi:hypothetical protein